MKIQGISELSAITEFSVIKEFNSHSVCKFSVSLNSCDFEFLDSKIGNEIKVSYEESNIFSGLINEIKTKNTSSRVMIEVELISTSIITDKDIHTRIFQNPYKRYQNIIHTLDFNNLEVDTQVFNISEKNIITQIDKSNFEFLKDLSNRFNLPIWVLDNNIIMKKSINEKIHKINEDLITSTMHYSSEDYNNIEIVSKELIEIGTKVSYENKEYIITSSNYEYKFGHMLYTYILNSKIDFKYRVDKHDLKEVLKVVEGVVDDNKDPEKLGRLKISFEKDKFIEIDSTDKEDRVWCHFRSQYSMFKGQAGISFIPEIGDLVEVYIYEDELVIGNVIRKTIIDDSIDESNEKFIRDKYNNYIRLNENGINIYNNNSKLSVENDFVEFKHNNTTGKLNDEFIELKIGDSTLRLENNSIKLKVNNSELKLTNNEAIIKAIKIELNGDSSINLKSKNIDINAIKVKVKGSSIDLG
ncbi:MAG: phage baseplate assembly protein V [Peptostreptococcaceae bacterium]